MPIRFHLLTLLLGVLLSVQALAAADHIHVDSIDDIDCVICQHGSNNHLIAVTVDVSVDFRGHAYRSSRHDAAPVPTRRTTARNRGPPSLVR